VLRNSLAFIRASNTTEVTLVVVGRKARDFYRRRPWQVKRDLIGFWDRLAYSHAAELADHFMQQYLDNEVDEVYLIYNEFRSVAVQRPVRQQLLPIPKADGDGQATAESVDYIYEPSPQAILGDLLPRHVRMQVFRALMESLAGEYGARMTAMEAATKNAKEMIEILSIQYNKARQEKITKELLDIVGGAEALKQGAEA
jgi:F-type H+-transporting ATPase subunit gamma